MTAPLNPNLPNGGGYPVSFFTRNARTSLGATDNYYTFASDYGDVSTYWHGVDINVNARTRNGVTLQGGTSTGRGVRDYCAVMQKLPETVRHASDRACESAGRCLRRDGAVADDGQRDSVAYTVPKIDVLVSQLVPIGGERDAIDGEHLRRNERAVGVRQRKRDDRSSSIAGSTLGRGSSPGLAFQTVDLTLPGQVYPDRVNSLDLRAARC